MRGVEGSAGTAGPRRAEGPGSPRPARDFRRGRVDPAAAPKPGTQEGSAEGLLARLRELPVIPAVRSLEDVEEACRRGAAAIFFFKGDVFGLREALPRCRAAGIPVYVHLDLLEGVGKDAAGIRVLKELGAAGVVSTRGPLLREARAAGLCPSTGSSWWTPRPFGRGCPRCEARSRTSWRCSRGWWSRTSSGSCGLLSRGR